MNIKGLFLFISSIVMLRSSLAIIKMHIKCRNSIYPRSKVERFPVPDEKVPWTMHFEEYEPKNYTSTVLEGKPWADPNISDPDFKPNWNTLDKNVNRESYEGPYRLVDDLPLNPVGRTGICGRGLLGRWGPNHAADPVVTRWKRRHDGTIELDKNKKRILQFVAIQRGDSKEWALPGGMVDPGEKAPQAALREFQEEATNSLAMSKDTKASWELRFTKFFNEGEEVYRGYVDDPRNTDNAWMETIAYNFHDSTGTIVGALNLHAGDDAIGVHWLDITPQLNLYASHKQLVDEVLKRRLADID